MEAVVGIVREVDKLGRIVIPKEFREQFGLSEKVEIIGTESGVLLRSPKYKLVKIREEDNEKSPL